MGGGTAVSLAGCTGGDGGDDGDGDDEFVASVGANPSTMDPSTISGAPANATVGTLAYQSLVAMTFDLTEVRGELATDWEQVDETTLQFELREGVQFHNGDDFAAEDVRFSIDRLRETVNGATVAWIDETEVVDDHEVVLHASQPHAPALSDLSAVPILPSGVDGVSETPTDDDFEFAQGSIGTGPFALQEFSSEDRVVLEAFEEYWYDGDDYPGTAPWSRVVFRVIPEQVTQEESMRAGELDMIDNAAPWELQQWDEANAEVITEDAVGFDFVSYPVNQPPYTNEKFRRGITRLIPRSNVLEAIFGGNATRLGGPLSPGLSNFWDEEHEQALLDEYVGEDPEAAEQLLSEAFEEEDVEAPFEVTMVTNQNRTRERWMEVIQQTLDETEFFDAELDVRAFDDLLPFLTDPEGAAESTDIVGIGWTGGSDPDGHVEQIIHSEYAVPDGFNWNLYENEDVDALIEEGQQTLDQAERRTVYHDLQELLAQEVPSAFMWTTDQIDVLNPDGFESLDDWQPHPNESYRYQSLYAPHLDQVAAPPE
jgi:peptide/nickel transport system substrate-binding protein